MNHRKSLTYLVVSVLLIALLWVIGPHLNDWGLGVMVTLALFCLFAAVAAFYQSELDYMQRLLDIKERELKKARENNPEENPSG